MFLVAIYMLSYLVPKNFILDIFDVSSLDNEHFVVLLPECTKFLKECGTDIEVVETWVVLKMLRALGFAREKLMRICSHRDPKKREAWWSLSTPFGVMGAPTMYRSIVRY
jgi:hypothetical protein